MRLIDADELKKHIRRCDDSETRATFDFVYDDDIDDAPTVCDIEQIRADIEAARYGLINDGLDAALRIIDKHIEGR